MSTLQCYGTWAPPIILYKNCVHVINACVMVGPCVFVALLFSMAFLRLWRAHSAWRELRETQLSDATYAKRRFHIKLVLHVCLSPYLNQSFHHSYTPTRSMVWQTTIEVWNTRTRRHICPAYSIHFKPDWNHLVKWIELEPDWNQFDSIRVLCGRNEWALIQIRSTLNA